MFFYKNSISFLDNFKQVWGRCRFQCKYWIRKNQAHTISLHYTNYEGFNRNENKNKKTFVYECQSFTMVHTKSHHFFILIKQENATNWNNLYFWDDYEYLLNKIVRQIITYNRTENHFITLFNFSIKNIYIRSIQFLKNYHWQTKAVFYNSSQFQKLHSDPYFPLKKGVPNFFGVYIFFYNHSPPAFLKKKFPLC